tara:strand:- start:202 stop:954 length:753 start_codon:yes stop_codon:yes gene_type:complete
MVMDLPYISILTPTYNRNNFIPLMLSNLFKMDYPKEKLEWIIDDDGPDKMLPTMKEFNQLSEVLKPIQLTYMYNERKRTIGEKRNNLCKKAKYKICAMMDTDDLYMSPYLKKSIEKMRKEKASLVGSNQMIFIYPLHNFKMTAIECESKRQIHEATMVFTKKHFKAMGGFEKNSQGEGAKMIDSMAGTKVALTDIVDCMCCIAHNDNTVKKDSFFEASDITSTCSLSEMDIKIITDVLLIDKSDTTIVLD